MTHWITGVVLAALTGFVLIGGIKSIGAVAEKLVVHGIVHRRSLLVLSLCSHIPAALGSSSSTLSAGRGEGGFSATIMLAWQWCQTRIGITT